MAKTHHEKIKEAIIDLGRAKPRQIMDWIKQHYPDDPVRPRSYRSDIIGCSVNHSSSHFFPHSPKFLWFEEDTKYYRLANSDEFEKAENEDIMKKILPSDLTMIDGIPVGKLSVTGQVVIPEKIREEMSLKPGDTLAFVINNQGVLEVRKAIIKLEIT